MVRHHNILKTSQYIEHCAPKMQASLWLLVSPKAKWKAKPSTTRLLSCGIILQFESRGKTSSLHLRIGLKHFFLMKLIVQAGQDRLGPALQLFCYIVQDCLGTSHDALSSSLLLPISICMHSCPINACYLLGIFLCVLCFLVSQVWCCRQPAVCVWRLPAPGLA